ncbi:MAG TPA: hypothetical protein VGM54_17625 [Chthoniobacter sp.]
MIPQTSITHTNPAFPSRPLMFARTETFGHTVLRFAKQNYPTAQGCFPMTD